MRRKESKMKDSAKGVVGHPRGKWPAVKWRCYFCSKFGHIAKLCKSKGSKAVGAFEEQEITEAVCDEVNEDLYNLNNLNIVSTSGTAPCRAMLKINKKLIAFEVDTGACKSVMSFRRYQDIVKIPLKPVRSKLKTVSGHDINAVGDCVVEVHYGENKYPLILTVIESKTDFVPLLGRNWLNVLFPNWQNYFVVANQLVNHVFDTGNSHYLNELKNKYKNVFDLNLCSPIKVFEVKFNIKDNVVPVIKKAYSMPYALKPRVEMKIDQMVAVGILKPVTNSEWASPIVVVPKKDGDIRICTDFRVTVNKVLNIDQYPLPRPDDIFASLAGGHVFTVLDLSGAYQQLKVHPDFQKYLTINTHVGLLQYTRLTYGIASAPAIFQSVIDQILCGIPRVNCYLDDILIAGRSLDECQKLVEKVFERLSKYNVKVNLDKCKFFEKEVIYLGHRINSEGIHPTVEKLRAISEAPKPQNITQLRAYLGLLNYYSKFLPMLSSQLRALYKLLEKDVKFNFNKECCEAFQLSKNLIIQNQVLTHYDPEKEIVISCDSSSYGVGAVLNHRINGVEKPVMFASGTLSKAERNYSQLEREALAIVFGLKKFHKYIFGRSFILVSDHQPLKFIFNPDRSISVMSASRIIRWNLILSAYDYKIEYRKGTQLHEADMLSRLPLQDPTEVDSSINSFNLTENIPICYEDIAKVSSKDPVLIKVIDMVRTGWPTKVDSELKPYFLKRNELSVEENCLMLGIKVVIPQALQKDVLDMIHEDHIGIVRSKILSRSIFWWPGLQQDIENMVYSCQVCQLNQNSSEKYLVSWPKTENVFQRIHIDFFYRNGIAYLLIVDSKSKWIDIHCMSKGLNVTQTIEKLKITFSVMGLPDVIVSDNGPPFNSSGFIKFCHIHRINVLKSPPYHPQSNGTAERHVQIVKTALDKFLLQKSTLTVEQQIVNFLFSYRNTPCANSGLSPNEVIFKIKPKTRLDLLKPKKGGSVQFKSTFDFEKPVMFVVGEDILVGKLGPYCNDKWKKGVIVKCISAVTYLVKVEDRIMYKHVNSLRKFMLDKNITSQVIPTPSLNVGPIPKVYTSETKEITNEVELDKENSDNDVLPEVTDTSASVMTNENNANSPGISVRHSNRIRRPPQRLGF